MHSCTHWLRPRNYPPPPHLGSYTRALLVSQDRRHLFVTPCCSVFYRCFYNVGNVPYIKSGLNTYFTGVINTQMYSDLNVQDFKKNRYNWRKRHTAFSTDSFFIVHHKAKEYRKNRISIPFPFLANIFIGISFPSPASTYK